MKILLFVVVIVFIISCRDNLIIDQKQLKYISEEDFAIEKTLTGTKINLDSVPMGGVTAIKIDSLLLFQFDWRVVEHHIKLYNAYSGKYIQQLLPVGRGPGESASFVHYYQIEKEDSLQSGIWVQTDFNFGLLNLQKSILEGKSIFDKQYDFNKRLDLFHKFVKNDSILIGKVYKHKKVPYYITYSIGQEKIIDTLQVFLPMKKIVEENMFASYDQIKPDKSKVVMVMNYFNVLNIISLDEKNIVSLAMGDAPLNYDEAWNVQGSKEKAMLYYDGLCVSDEYIFCLYKNCLRVDKKLPPQIQVLIFDWNGIPQFKLKLAENISNISFDEKEQCLYGMSRRGEETVFRYDLKDVLRNINGNE